MKLLLCASQWKKLVLRRWCNLLAVDRYNDLSFGHLKFLGSFTSIYNGEFKVNLKEVEKMQFFSLKEIQEMINQKEKFHPELLFLLEKHFGIKK